MNRSGNPFVPSAVVFLIVALAAAVVATGCNRPIDLPDDLAGTWETSHPTYADRAFTLSPGSIEFDLGEHGRASHPIDAVYLDSTDDGRDLFTIVYIGDGGLEYRYTLVREGTPAEALIPENQPGLRWTRRGG